MNDSVNLIFTLGINWGNCVPLKSIAPKGNGVCITLDAMVSVFVNFSTKKGHSSSSGNLWAGIPKTFDFKP